MVAVTSAATPSMPYKLKDIVSVSALVGLTKLIFTRVSAVARTQSGFRGINQFPISLAVFPAFMSMTALPT